MPRLYYVGKPESAKSIPPAPMRAIMVYKALESGKIIKSPGKLSLLSHHSVRHRSKRQRLHTLLSLLVILSVLISPFAFTRPTAAKTPTGQSIADTMAPSDAAIAQSGAASQVTRTTVPTAAPNYARTDAKSNSTPPPAPPTSDAGITATSVASDTVPTPVRGTPTPAPTIERPQNTNYVDQAAEANQNALLAEIGALPSTSLDPNTESALVKGSTGGKVKSKDSTLTLAMLPGTAKAKAAGGGTNNTRDVDLQVKIKSKKFNKGDKKAKYKDEPVAYAFELTAKQRVGGPEVTHFQKNVALVWDINIADLRAQGVRGWPLRAYTYDEQNEAWVEVPSWWNDSTQQLIAVTSHFSDYAVGSGFSMLNNYVPTLSGFEVDLQTGAATASYPINLPPGPGGIAPNVSLSYNSTNVERVNAGQQGSSSVGWGWSLSTSYIAASQQHFASNKDPWTVSIVSDGANGVLIKGDDGYWHTSDESFAKVRFNQSANSWEAWDSGGTYYLFEFGGHIFDASHSTQTTTVVTNRWMLSKVVDTHGNTINYGYYYEEKGFADTATPVSVPITNTGQRTRAVYPREISYGGDLYGISSTDKISVTFQLDNRVDIYGQDRDAGIFQSKRITRIDVNRKQPNGVFRKLRSYVLNHDYSIELGPTLGNGHGEFPHLTLTSITPLGKEPDAGGAQAQLPSTSFLYYDRTSTAGNWGHLRSVNNGYGGEVRYYYDRAAADVHESYRRVSGKRVRDGLSPVVADEFSNQSLPHDSLYTYEYRGAATNGANMSFESDRDGALHERDSEWRGFAWVRETDPSGQATEHYFSQTDATKGKEWRTQSGKADTYTSAMAEAPTNNSDWTFTGHREHRTNFNTGTDTNSWKMYAIAPDGTSPQGSSATRNGTVFDGQEVSSRFYIAGSGDDAKLKGSWKLVQADDPAVYWGVEIGRKWNPDVVHPYEEDPLAWPPPPTPTPGAYEYHATVVWQVRDPADTTAPYTYISGSRSLTRLENALVARPYRATRIEPQQWYTARLHTSPDGRFTVELFRDGRDYIAISSEEPKDATGAKIPLLPTGKNWKFEQKTWSMQSGVDPGYQFLLDSQVERRTVYSQSDTWYKNDPPVGPTDNGQGDGYGNLEIWQPGLANNANGMFIYLAQTQRSWSTTYGNACCQLGQYLRTMTDYVYTNDAYRNLAAVYEHGNFDAAGDERSTYNGYHNLVNIPTRYLPGKKAWTHVYKGITGDVYGANWMSNGVFIYEGSTTWDYMSPTSKGDLVQVQTYNMREGVSTAGLPDYTSQKIVYDAYGNQEKTIDANNNSSPVTTYDTYYHAFPVSVLHPNGRTETTVWNYTLDVPETATDMNNVTAETRYDDFGRPTKSWIPTGGIGSEAVPNEEYFLPGLNQTSVTPPFSMKYKLRLGTQAGTNEHTWQSRWFDGRGRTIQDVSPKTGTNTIRVDTAYNVNGQVEKATLPFEVSVTAPDTYRVPTWTQPLIWNAYDGVGRTTWQQNPDDTRIMTNYLWLQRVDVWDELNHGKFTYTDAYGRLSTVLEYDSADPGYQPQGAPNHIATEYTYDVLDNLTSVKRNAWVSAPNTPVVTTMEYDGLGRKKAMNDPDMGRWEYGYDNVGNLTSQKDALYLSNPTQFANHLLLIEYDNMNRPTNKYYGQAHKNSNLADVRFYYDNALNDATATRSWGRLRKAEVTGVDGQSSKANSQSYAYDIRGQLLSETINSAQARNNGNYTIGYQYDTAGRLKSVVYPDPDTTHEQVDVTYNQQAIGLPTRLDSNKDNGVYPVLGATYNARGQLTELQQGSAGPTGDLLKTTYTYDDVDDGNSATAAKRGWLSRSLVTTGGGATLLDLNLTYENNGNVKTVSQNAGGANSPTFTNSFTYDQKDRLTGATSTGTNGNASLWPSESYTFDDLHRMRTRTIGSIANSYTYPATSGTGSHLDAPIAYQGVTYQYDANGNQIARIKNGVTETRTFDPEGRIVKIDDGSIVTEYIYNANGQRLIKSTTTSIPTPTATPSTGLRGEYYSGTSFNNYKLTRYDDAIDFSWGTGSPDPALPADGFSVRWTGYVYAPAGSQGPNVDTSYTVGVTSDAGVRVWVNGQLRIDNWTAHSAVENRSTFTLKSNRVYPITVEYYEGATTADAKLQMYWLVRNAMSCQVDPSACWSRGLPMSLTPPSSGGSLLAEYYDNPDFTGLKFTRRDPAVRFDWGSGSPDASVGVDTFSARWSGKVTATTSGTYTFYTMSDDGVRLWVNGQQLVNNWTDHAPTENSGQIALNAGQQYDIKLEYYENGWGAMVELLWLPPGGTKQVIPPSQFSPAPLASLPNGNTRTIYIGGMYEEDITPGSTVTQYTSYYSLAGKLVGMRKVVGTTSTQYRVVGDHLGSVSLIVDTQNPPVVVQRTYNKPYGEVAYSWSATGGGPTSLTSKGYTGQRLEVESGLMFYNARFYDPALSYFVSADTIAPDKDDPSTRNRYSYVSSNPLSFTDPTGHCEDDPNDPGGCERAQNDLLNYGIKLLDIDEWQLEELKLVLEAIQALMDKSGWSIDQFKSAMGITEGNLVSLENVDFAVAHANDKCSQSAACTVGGRKIQFDLARLRSLGAEKHDGYIRWNMVHELAHVWDRASKNYMQQALMWRTGTYCTCDENGEGTYHAYYDPRNQEAPATSYHASAAEDWAESVAAYVWEGSTDPYFQKHIEPNLGPVRRQLVRDMFDLYK